MQFDTSGIDRAALAREVGVRYGISVAGLAFVPKGEDAYGFADEGHRVFVRAQAGAMLKEPYEVAAALREEGGVRAVLAPLRGLDGTLSFRFGCFTVAIFPFIYGPSLWEMLPTDRPIAEAAAVIAQVHAARLQRPPARRERFENPFADRIRQALGARPARGSRRATDVWRLLATERESVLELLNDLDRLGAQCRGLPLRWVVTHGDPNLANFLVDRHGGLHLTDWGEVALGPVERDLFFFTGDRFELALRRYGPVPLHEEAFAFYQWRWCVQEVADYTTRLLFGHGDPADAEHDWEKLAPYLPIRREALAGARQRVAETLLAFRGGRG